jgi:hypothetical protein
MLAADELPGGVAGAVLQVGGQHLVAGLQVQRARDDVDAGGGVGHEDQVVGACAEEASQPPTRFAQQRGRAAAEEVHRVAFHLAAASLAAPPSPARAGAERAVVEEDQVRGDPVPASNWSALRPLNGA